MALSLPLAGIKPSNIKRSWLKPLRAMANEIELGNGVAVTLIELSWHKETRILPGSQNAGRPQSLNKKTFLPPESSFIRLAAWSDLVCSLYKTKS